MSYLLTSFKESLQLLNLVAVLLSQLAFTGIGLNENSE